MKFLLELMSCCGSKSNSGKEETRSLVGWRRGAPPPSSSSLRRGSRIRGVKRGRSSSGRHRNGRSGGSSVGEWRPSLSSISEDDNVLYERSKERKEAVAAGSSSERNIKRTKARSRSIGEDHG